MFSYRQTETLRTEDEISFSQYQFDTENAVNPKKVINISASKSVTFGISNVDIDEINILSQIAVSPKIEYYDTKLSKWLELYRGDSIDIAIDNFNAVHSFEITLQKAPILTQF